MSTLYQATFSGPLSSLLQGRDAAVVVAELADIASQHKLSGLLIIEEGHFCHYVEGDKASIAKVRAMAGCTPDGSYSLTLDEGHLVTGRRMQGWHAQCAIGQGFIVSAEEAREDTADDQLILPSHAAVIGQSRASASVQRRY